MQVTGAAMDMARSALKVASLGAHSENNYRARLMTPSEAQRSGNHRAV